MNMYTNPFVQQTVEDQNKETLLVTNKEYLNHTVVHIDKHKLASFHTCKLLKIVKRYASGTDSESTANTPTAHVSPSMGKSTAVARKPVLQTHTTTRLADSSFYTRELRPISLGSSLSSFIRIRLGNGNP